MSTDKYQILETITAISKLILLAFKPKGTKIAIRGHVIVLCEPNVPSYYGFIKIPQGVDRALNSDSREDLYVINPVICHFIEWYIIPYKHRKEDQKLYKGLINMAKYLRVGLRELQNVYKVGTTVLTIQHYINILTAVIENTFSTDMLYKVSEMNVNDGKSAYPNSLLDDDEVLFHSTIFDVTKFKNFWTRDELQSLCDQFDSCFRYSHQQDTIVFKDDAESEYGGSDNADTMSYTSASGFASNGDLFSFDMKNSSSTKDDQASPDISGLDLNTNNVSFFTSQSPINGQTNMNDHDSILSNLDISEHATEGYPPTRVGSYQSSYLHQPTPQILPISPIGSNSNTHRKKEVKSKSSNTNASNINGAKLWPIPKSQTNVIVQGHLVGITNMLLIMDKRFTHMLSQSVKGTN
jgi:hypothetical protein